MADLNRTHELHFGTAAAVWAALLLTGIFAGLRLGFEGWRFASVMLVCGILLAGYLAPAVRPTREGLLDKLGTRGALVVIVPLAAFLLYSASVSRDWKSAALGIAYLLAPCAVLTIVGARDRISWLDFAAVLIVWLPVEFRWIYRLFPYPQPLTHTLTILLAINAGLAAFIFTRQLEGIGYVLEWRRGFAKAFAINLALFTVIAIPLGEAIGFIHWDPSLSRLRSSAIFALGILVFTAWPEEFLFRGLLQNLLTRTFRSERGGLLVAAVIFGFSHIVHAPFPNWKYVILATIAGIFYGRAWMKTGSLVPGTLVHAAVDILWHLLFR